MAAPLALICPVSKGDNLNNQGKAASPLSPVSAVGLRTIGGDSSSHSSSASPPPSAGHTPLFEEAIKRKLIPEDAAIFSPRQENLVADIIGKWSLGDSTILIDLLGLEISHLLRSGCPEQSAPYEKLYTTFEAYFFTLYVSLIANAEVEGKEDQKTYFDSRILPPLQTAWKALKAYLDPLFSEVELRQGAIEEETNKKCSKTPKIKEKKLNDIRLYKAGLVRAKKILDLIESVVKSPLCPTMIKNSIGSFVNPEKIKIEDPHKAFADLRLFAQFQYNLFYWAHKKELCGVKFTAWPAYIEKFPTSLSKGTLQDIAKKSLELIADFDLALMQTQQDYHSARAGTLTIEQYAESMQNGVLYLKNPQELLADTMAKYTGVTLALVFMQNRHRFIDQDLQPRVCPRYRQHTTCFNQMVKNFFAIYSPDGPFASNIYSPPPSLDELDEGLLQITLQLFFSFDLDIQAQFIKHDKQCRKMGFYSPYLWTQFFELVKPIVNEKFGQALAAFKDLHATHLASLEKELMRFDSRTEKMEWVEKRKEFLFQKSLQVCRLILFYIDIRQLMSLHEEELIEKEDLLLPQDVFDFLEIAGIEALIEQQLQALAEVAAEGAAQAKKQKENISPLEKAIPLKEPEPAPVSVVSAPVSTAAPIRKSANASKAVPKKVKPVACQKTTPPNNPSFVKTVIFEVAQGEKAKNLVRRIQRELGVTPIRMTASHIIYPGGAVLPVHGGSSILKAGTASSFVGQLLTTLGFDT